MLIQRSLKLSKPTHKLSFYLDAWHLDMKNHTSFGHPGGLNLLKKLPGNINVTLSFLLSKTNYVVGLVCKAFNRDCIFMSDWF